MQAFNLPRRITSPPQCVGVVASWNNCIGTLTWPDGKKYVGEIRDGKRNGQGTHTWPSGQKYVGEYRDDQRNGQGTMTFPNGRVESGRWENNEFVGSAVVSNPARPPAATGSNEVRLIKEGGTFTVPVTINGALTLGFTVDSGASDVSIPEDVVTTLIRTGTISESDFLGEQTYRLADGSKVKSRTFRIRQLTVGNRTVNNVLGSVAGVKGSLLLGQSFLSRFSSVKFDYGRQVLVLE